MTEKPAPTPRTLLSDTITGIVRLCAMAYLGVGAIGFCLSFFKMLFIPDPLDITRGLLYLGYFPMGAHLFIIKEPAADVTGELNIKLISKCMLSTCLFVIGTIGIVIGTMEVTPLFFTHELLGRMVCYALCTAGALLLSPLRVEKTKIE